MYHLGKHIFHVFVLSKRTLRCRARHISTSIIIPRILQLSLTITATCCNIDFNDNFVEITILKFRNKFLPSWPAACISLLKDLHDIKSNINLSSTVKLTEKNPKNTLFSLEIFIAFVLTEKNHLYLCFYRSTFFHFIPFIVYIYAISSFA